MEDKKSTSDSNCMNDITASSIDVDEDVPISIASLNSKLNIIANDFKTYVYALQFYPFLKEFNQLPPLDVLTKNITMLDKSAKGMDFGCTETVNLCSHLCGLDSSEKVPPSPFKSLLNVISKYQLGGNNTKPLFLRISLTFANNVNAFPPSHSFA